MLVYMLTKRGYIDGIQVTIYSIHGSYGYIYISINYIYSTRWLMIIPIVNPYLVGGAITPLEKYEFVNGKDLSHVLWKINND